MAQKKTFDKLTVEEAFAEAEKRIDALEDESLSLEDAFVRYKEGMELIKYLDGSIDRMEKQVMKVTEDLKLTPLDGEEDMEDG